jgi:hypothetical protein
MQIEPWRIVFALVFFAVAGSNFAMVRMIEDRLQTAHREAWEKLGRPRRLGWRGFVPTVRLMLFVLRGRYRPLGDEKLNRLAMWAKVPFALSLALGALMVGISLFFLGAILI